MPNLPGTEVQNQCTTVRPGFLAFDGILATIGIQSEIGVFFTAIPCFIVRCSPLNDIQSILWYVNHLPTQNNRTNHKIVWRLYVGIPERREMFPIF
jgi:hypothetical protein